MKPRRHTRASFLLLSLLLAFPSSPGCRNRELLETALRSREQDVMVLREELARVEFYNEALQREISAIRHHPAHKIPPELAAQTFTLCRIDLGRSTGGYDGDCVFGDEALQVVIEPRDGGDALIKAPGAVQVTALEITPSGLKAPLGLWQIPPDMLRQTWKQGLFSTGYVLILPWQKVPASEDVRVVVRFELSDGRLFEADRNVKVRLNPLGPRGAPQPPFAAGEPIPFRPATPQHPPVETLPLPRPVEPLPPSPEPTLPDPAVPDPVPPEFGGPALQPAGYHRSNRWTPVSMDGAVKLRRPVPLHPPEMSPGGP